MRRSSLEIARHFTVKKIKNRPPKLQLKSVKVDYKITAEILFSKELIEKHELTKIKIRKFVSDYDLGIVSSIVSDLNGSFKVFLIINKKPKQLMRGLKLQLDVK